MMKHQISTYRIYTIRTKREWWFNIQIMYLSDIEKWTLSVYTFVGLSVEYIFEIQCNVIFLFFNSLSTLSKKKILWPWWTFFLPPPLIGHSTGSYQRWRGTVERNEKTKRKGGGEDEPPTPWTNAGATRSRWSL